MALFKTNLVQRDLKLSRWADLRFDLEHPWEGDVGEVLAAAGYLRDHDLALRWAKANRGLIARRFVEALGAEAECLWDGCHNSILRAPSPGLAATPSHRRGEGLGVRAWVHRKGAVAAEGGPAMIPGSRGTLSYLVKPTGDGASHRLGAIKLAQGDDLLDVMFGVEAPLFQLQIVIVSLGAQGQKAQEELLLARLFAVQEQGRDVVGQLVILVAVVAAHMLGHQLLPVINQEPVGMPLEGELARGVLAGNRVAVAVHFNAELAVDSDGVYHRRFVRYRVQGVELFLGLPEATGPDLEALMVGKIQVTGVEDHGAGPPAQDGDFAVIDPDLAHKRPKD